VIRSLPLGRATISVIATLGGRALARFGRPQQHWQGRFGRGVRPADVRSTWCCRSSVRDEVDVAEPASA
jgi:hypothetical protein